MSIKREIVQAVKRYAELNRSTLPKTPAEQEQIVFEVEEAFRNSTFDFNNATSVMLSQGGKSVWLKNILICIPLKVSCASVSSRY